MQGQLIRSIFPTKEERLVKIPVNDLPTGWYVLQYRSSRQLHSRRFFKS
jgi:predicted lipid carrier protein YhbT